MTRRFFVISTFVATHTTNTQNVDNISTTIHLFVRGLFFYFFFLLYFIWFLSRSCGSFSSFVQLNSCSLSSFIFLKRDAEEDVKTKFSFLIYFFLPPHLSSARRRHLFRGFSLSFFFFFKKRAVVGPATTGLNQATSVQERRKWSRKT